MLGIKEMLRFKEMLICCKSFIELDERSKIRKNEILRNSTNVFKRAYVRKLEKL